MSQSAAPTHGHVLPPETDADRPAAHGDDPVVETSVDRSTQPISAEGRPRLPFPVIGVGASAGGLEAYTEFLKGVPADCGMAFVLIQHLSPKHESVLADILARVTPLTVLQVEDSMPVEPNHVYVIRPGYTLTIAGGHLHLGKSVAERGSRRPVDDFFRSLADEQRERAIAVVLSGTGSNGTAGAQAVKAVGGFCIAQDPDSAKFPSMPRSLIDNNVADTILRPQEMYDTIARYAENPYATGGLAGPEAVATAERQALSDVITVIRTRARHDFSGYKKPTLVRRIQRRMSLLQIESMSDYVKVLRQSPGEVTALSDDMMIHVTGFFRDADVWDFLRERVIVPLLTDKSDGDPVRCWVTACSSGEEAYTLGILLMEVSEMLGKRFDIKIFATDTAERSLQQARAGVFPGGIESEVAPARLDRWFDKDDAFYRVKKELRELVVFAPQNLLQDPPFSRLDICTCRNLLIYIEADVQRRLLSMLHFGLRENGTLLLGTSETITGAEDLFEPIDKKLRVFRRVGPTRHGTINFPVTPFRRSSGLTLPASEDTESRVLSRGKIAQLAAHTLLEQLSPAAVVIDRAGQIVYFHGNTEGYLTQPRGEPTRDLSALVREEVRGAVRAAVQRTTTTGEVVRVRDGTVGTGDDRRRVEVVVMPLEPRPAAEYFLIAFETRPEVVPVAVTVPAGPDHEHLSEELRRVRDELQSTVEELQTSNEEMKASHEEVTSVNEELQSTNEELETSKEELQSLNEELTTVNAQLQSKMEELERTTNDLSSLLSSTDIAVIFLDTNFRIRRFTPAARDLVELIASDVGRPLNDLARKFEDPDLAADAQAVLDKLLPIEREVMGTNGLWYVRRVLPYRTADNRINGVVVTFVDITERRHATVALGESEQHLRMAAEAASMYAWDVDLAKQTFRWPTNALRASHFPTPETMKDLLAVVHPDDVVRVRAAFVKASQPGGGFSLDYRVAAKPAGEETWVFSAGVTLGGPDGKPNRIVGVSQNITDRKRAEAAMRESEEQVRRQYARTAEILESISDAFYAVDSDFRFTYVNREAERLWGRRREDLLGRHYWTEFPKAIGTDSYDQHTKAMSERRPIRYESFSTLIDRWIDVSLYPEAGGGLSCYFFDVTDRRNAELALRDSEEQFRLATSAAHMGFWDFNVPHNTVHWDRTHNELLGLPADQRAGTADQFFERVHEDDLDTVRDALRGIVERQEEFAVEFRVVHPDGAVRWIAGTGRIVAEVDGRVTRIIGGVLDITDRKETELVLHAAKETAELANRVKDEFLATLSHELRTPLSAILVWSSVLKGKSLSPEEVAEGIDAIQRSAESQKQLIEDLLDSARITSGKLRLEMAITPLRSVLEEAIEAVRPTAEGKDITVASVFDPSAEPVLADVSRMRQVVWNLLSNAVKFTPRGGHIDISLMRRGAFTAVCVADDGQGIEPDFLPHVFERFKQADASTTRSAGGLGLGLAIVKQIVEMHNGTITAESPGVGQGATFTVLLPAPHGKAVSKRTKPAGKPRATPKIDLTGVRVLLVEDQPEVRRATARLLTDANVTVDEADTAEAAVRAFDASRPDVLLSDIGLPDADGYALLERLHAADRAAGRPPVPAVAVTAFAQQRDRRRAEAAGFAAFLPKPFRPAELIQHVGVLSGRVAAE